MSLPPPACLTPSCLRLSPFAKAWDARFIELRSLPQVTITPHTAFLTHEALASIAATLTANLRACAAGDADLVNEVKARP